MYNSTIFNRYINEIGDPKIQEIVEECLQKCPKEFYTMPASTTGKYHPPFALGEGGLVRHTLAACCWVKDLLQLEQYSILLPKADYILAALILHDSVKKGFGKSKYTVFEHPIYAAELVTNVCEELAETNGSRRYIECGAIISRLIASHMGQWNRAFNSNVTLPKPKSDIQQFVHLCDYLASRKGDPDVYINSSAGSEQEI